MKKISLLLLTFVALFSLAACGSEALEIELSETFIELELGESQTIDVTTNLEVETSFLSLNTNVASVNDSGVVNAVGLGSTNIRVTVGDISETVTVKVNPVPVVEEPEVILTAESVRDTFYDVRVAYGSSLADTIGALPSSTIVYDDAGNPYIVDLAWVIPAYNSFNNPLEETNFVATASFSLPEGLEPGDISFEVSLNVIVLPVASEMALSLLNTDPSSATLSTFEDAGVKDVSSSNLEAVKAALVVAKNVTLNPGWSPSDIQAVVDNININGGTYEMNLTLDADGSLDYIELSSSNRYLVFDSEMISTPLLAFLNTNSDLLDGQKATFEISLSVNGNQLERINYLELTNKEVLYQNILSIPAGPKFNNLTINGLNQEFYVDFVIGANNVTVRNAKESSVITVELASNINIDDSSIRRLINTIDTTVNLTDVILTGEMHYNPLISLIDYDYTNRMTGIEYLGSTPLIYLNPLLTEDPASLIGTEFGEIYAFFILETGFGTFGLPFGPENIFSELLLAENFETREEVIAYTLSMIELSQNLTSSNILFENFDPEELEELLFILGVVPTIESLNELKLTFETSIQAVMGEKGLDRYIDLLNASSYISTYLLSGTPQEIDTLPELNLVGELKVDGYVDLLGRVNGLDVVSTEEDSEFYIYQGSYVKNFSFDKNITLETGESGPYFPFGIFGEPSYSSSNIVALEDGSFYNGIYEIDNDLVLLLLGNIDGNGAVIAYEGGITDFGIDIVVGLSPMNKSYIADDFYFSWVTYSSWNLLNENNQHQGNATLSNIDFSDYMVEVVVVGENNSISNSTLGALTVYQNTEDVVLTLSDSVIADGAEIDILFGQVVFDSLDVEGSLNLDSNEETTITLNNDLTINENETITFDISGNIINLENLTLYRSGILLSGQTISVNVAGTGVLSKWQVATEAGIYTDVVTASSITLSSTEAGKTLRLVLVNTNTQEVVVVEVLGEVALDALDVENSTVTLDSEASVQAGSNNVSLELELKTANDLDVITPADVNFIVSSAGVVLSDQTINLSSSGVLTFTLTDAGIYDDIMVYVSESGVLSAFDQSFDITVLAATPHAISIVSPTNLTQVGAGVSYDIELLVEDTYGNPVPNAVVSLSAVDLNDDGSGFASQTMMTGADGTLVAPLAIDPVALPRTGISVLFEIDGDSQSFTGIQLFESVSSDSSASVIDATVVAGTNVEIAVTLIDTKDIPQAITGTSLTMLLVDGTLETGTVVATASAVNYTATTGTALFSINTANNYDVNLYVETFEGSNEFVLVQADLVFEVSAAAPLSLEGPVTSGQTIDLEAGSTNEMTFTLEDAYGNLIDDEVVTFELTGIASDTYINTSNTTSGTLTINANGEYVFNLIIANDEVFAGDPDLTLTLAVSGEAINFTVDIDVNNTLNASASSVDDAIESIDIVAGNNNVELVVTLVNVSGDAIETDALGVYLEMADNSTLAGVLQGTGVTRKAVFTITDTSIDTDGVTLFVQRALGITAYSALSPSLDLSIVADVPNALNVSPSSTQNVFPGESTEYVATITDQYGNPVEGEDITLELSGRLGSDTVISGSSNGSSRTLSTNALGQATFTIVVGDEEPFGNLLYLTFNASNSLTEIRIINTGINVG